LHLVSSSVLRMLDRIRLAAHGRSEADPDTPARRAWRLTRQASPAALSNHWRRLLSETAMTPADREALLDPATAEAAHRYEGNIESMVGTVKVPVGVVGPLRVNGHAASGDYLVPLATTEGALVASYARGAETLARAGGVDAAILYEGVLRSPAFVFADLGQAFRFVDWIAREQDALRDAAEATTRFGKLVSIDPLIEADTVFLVCRYTTGDASGQNMVTIATEALCRHALDHGPVAPLRWYLEGNYSGDKKATALGMVTGRGRRVTASAVIPAAVVERCLRVGVGQLLDYGRIANLGSLLSGQFGAQGHYANGLAAFYLATGQDVACVAESAMGVTRMEERGGDLFASVTLPNVLVGSVGGGTGLPTQSAALRMMGLHGAGNGPALAEVVAALCLAGELSIMAALAAGQFADAHRKLARGTPRPMDPRIEALATAAAP
jgi:hydroxymethylglutaryl-CoA reductase (NADPH)